MTAPDALPASVELHGGPLDGERLPVAGWTREQLAEGAALISPRSAYGPGGRSCYGPPAADPLAAHWHWEGDTP